MGGLDLSACHLGLIASRGLLVNSSLSFFVEAVFWYWVFDERSIIGHCRRFQSPMKMLSSGLSECLSFRICSKKGTIFDSFGPYREKMLRV